MKKKSSFCWGLMCLACVALSAVTGCSDVSDSADSATGPLKRQHLVPNSVGVVILYDNSGSMWERIPDGHGGRAQKITLADDAISKTMVSLQTFGDSHGILYVGLDDFDGTMVSLKPYKESLKALASWLASTKEG